MFVPIVIILGMLATAVLGSGGRDAQAPVLGPIVAETQPPVPPAAAAPTAPEPATAAPATPAPADQVPPSPLPQPEVVEPPGVALPAPPPAQRTAPAPAPAPSPARARARAYTPAGVERRDVGEGAQGAAIFRAAGTPAQAGPVVIFLHGWVAIDAQRYGPWIGHLARGGTTVIFPAYQTRPAYDTVSPLANVLAGVRIALSQVQVAPGRLVVAGHSAGGALAVDYAAVAAVHGLPAPAAIFSVYPGRKLRHLSVAIPEADLSDIAADTRMLTFVGERDTAVGSGTAHRIVEGAAHAGATLQIIRDDAVDDHSAPRRYDGAAQRTFWAPLDTLVAETAQNAP
ncbi:MAG TPA: alpha/beta hydrolase [Solirubrobacteraceae bacterium]|nr:alpha/beta hydrolase [Solirubrobacteraceae bacterium]